MNALITEILQAREARAAKQQALIQAFGCPVVSFTMTIAGPVKTSPRIRRAFDAGLAELDKALSGYPVRSREVVHGITGDEAILCVDGEAAQIKAICTAIEEATPMGRLFDMDVLDVRGNKLERGQERCCLVCGMPGRSCAASRRHSVETLQAVTKKLIDAHLDDADACQIAEGAVDALLEEVTTTPKPGLVDLRNHGSHRDMNPQLFAASAKALYPYFYRCAMIGS